MKCTAYLQSLNMCWKSSLEESDLITASGSVFLFLENNNKTDNRSAILIIKYKEYKEYNKYKFFIFFRIFYSFLFMLVIFIHVSHFYSF